MTGEPLGSRGRFASLTAPGGGTNFPRIALASAAARCFAGPDGWLLTVTAVEPEVAAVCGAEVTVPQPAASAAVSTPRKRNGFGFLTLTTLGRQPRGTGSARSAPWPANGIPNLSVNARADTSGRRSLRGNGRAG